MITNRHRRSNTSITAGQRLLRWKFLHCYRNPIYHATDTAITIGIQGPDTQERINQLRDALSKLITKHGWTTRDEPR
ncbi:hypothetical protein FHR32_007315 [Streptosporangium album]|uniref:Uncharacterized protein n=1 Tax=Streptosporangium album TaxID=47479 RepID=A0A7W7WE01_9ACTN|nr:hypothetical protein [Streptosporangium album]MBB4942915.1 hypothetical protein [Streptosporangium album]